MTIIRSAYNHGYNKEYSEEISGGLFLCRIMKVAKQTGLYRFACYVDGKIIHSENFSSVVTSEMKEIILEPYAEDAGGVGRK